MFMLIASVMTFSSISQTTLTTMHHLGSFKTETECNQSKQSTELLLRKLNEDAILGYSIECKQN